MATTHQRGSDKAIMKLETARKKWREGMELLAMLDLLEDVFLMDMYREKLWAKVDKLSAIINDLDKTPMSVRKPTEKERETFLVDAQKYLEKL